MAPSAVFLSSTAQAQLGQSSRQSTAPAAVFRGAFGPTVRRGPSVRLARGPQAFGGYRGSCGPYPGTMGSVNMGNFMNKPLAEVLQQLQKDMNAAQQQARQQQPNGSSSPSARNGSAGLPVDMIDTEDAVWFFVDVPGIDKPDLQIKANQQDRTLTISGERSQPTVGTDAEAKQSRNLQRLFGKFSHTIALPKDADPQLISAKVDKGVLRIKVLKQTAAEPEVQDVRID